MTIFEENLSKDGTPIIRVENDFLQVDVAPGVGGRIVNILEKSSGHQFLWHNKKLKLERLGPGAEYDPNFYGGVDELIPNDIPETLNGLECPDHGEMWTMALDYRIDGEALVLTGTLPIFGLHYERRMALRSNSPHIDLDYHIKKCEGPCEGLVSEEQYNAMIHQVETLLKGKTESLITVLTEEMETAAAGLRFEEAALLRDRIKGLQAYSGRQKASDLDATDRDIVACAAEGDDACGVVFRLRDGKLIGRQHPSIFHFDSF